MVNELDIALQSAAPRAINPPHKIVQFTSNTNENSSNCPMVTKPNPVNPIANKIKTQRVNRLYRFSLRNNKLLSSTKNNGDIPYIIAAGIMSMYLVAIDKSG